MLRWVKAFALTSNDRDASAMLNGPALREDLIYCDEQI